MPTPPEASPSTQHPQTSGRRRKAQQPLFEPLGWGLLRAPLLPPSVGQEALQRPDVRLALEIASGQLASELERSGWSLAASSATVGLSGRSARHDERLQRSWRAYLARMRQRPTPFGLCAAVALVSFGTGTDVAISAASPQARGRLDMGVLGAVIAQLETDEVVRPRLRWTANPATTTHDDRLFLSERSAGPLPRPGVSVRATPASLAVLARARRAVPYSALVEAVRERPGATPEVAERLVSELCRESFLVSELWGVIGDPRPQQCLVELLERPEVAAAAQGTLAGLIELGAALAVFDAGPAVGPYRAAAAIGAGMARGAEPVTSAPVTSQKATASSQKATAPPPRGDHLLQVDGRWPLGGSRLNGLIAAAAGEAGELLLRLGTLPDGPPHISAWRNSFIATYGRDAFVPVTVAIDRSLGIGPPGPSGGAILAGRRAALARRDTHIYNIALDALRERQTVWELDDTDLATLSLWGPGDSPPPDDIDLVVGVAASSVQAVDRGDFACVVSPTVGAQAAGKVTGRFADLLGPEGDAALASVCAGAPARAEVVYRPNSDRLLNVALRPNLTGMVVPVGTPPVAGPGQEVVLPQDLLIGVEDGRLVLVTTDGQRVVPVATHMLSLSRAPELARLLLDVPRDGRPVLTGLSWGRASSLPVLPRSQRGRVVLSPARWLCSPAQVSSEIELERWRARWGPPALCYRSEGDNRLLVDLDDPADRKDLLRSLARRRVAVRLDEALPGPEHAWLPGPDGYRMVEVAVPLRAVVAARSQPPAGSAPVSATAPLNGTPATAVPVGPTAPAYRPWAGRDGDAVTRVPGSEWLFLKLYVDRDAMTSVLVDELGGLLDEVHAAGLAEQWFFVRYGDPRPHLRLRWRQALGAGPGRRPADLSAAVLSWAYDLHRRGLASRVVVDTYDREVTRYGGPQAIELAERIFAADSALVRGVLALGQAEGLTGEGQPFADDTEVAALTLDRLLVDFGLDLDQRSAFYAGAPTDDRRAGRDYRERKRGLREVVAGVRRHPLEPLLAQRSAAVQPVAGELRAMGAQLSQPLESVHRSFLHMHVNRLLYVGRYQEQLIYGLLERTTRSLAQAPLAAGGPGTGP